ncbi:MAG: DUF3048 domain-containing protein [Patescibacteria group bacterium]
MRRFALQVVFLLASCAAVTALGAGPEAGVPPDGCCRFCGAALAGDPGPALAVMIDNHVGARPQSGLAQACLVFEAPVEGGITRFMAVYGHGQEVAEIGPVRSMRPYFVRLAAALDAVLCHCGGSPEAYALASATGLPRLDDLRGAGRAFWRDNRRKAPHNLYTSTSRLRRELARRHLPWAAVPAASLPFLPAPAGIPAAEALLAYSSPHFRASFVFDPAGGFYTRHFAGLLQRQRDGAPLCATAVVVVGIEPQVTDRVGRLRIDLEGERPCLVYQSGGCFTASWSGAPGRAGLVTDAAGQAAALKPGLAWFALVPGEVRPPTPPEEESAYNHRMKTPI